MKKLLPALLAILFLAACAPTSSVEPNAETASEENQANKDEIAAKETENNTPAEEEFDTISVKDNKIFYSGEERVFIENDILNIILDGKIISFPGDIEKIGFVPINTFKQFYYGDKEHPNLLIFTGSVVGPYKTYEPTEKVNYECNGSLADNGNLDFYLCETNGENFLTQFEFNAADSLGFATGGGVDATWRKIYIKKVGDIDLIFIGRLDQFFDYPKASAGISSTPCQDGADYNQEMCDRLKTVESEDYLLELIKDPEVQNKISEWDRFVKETDFKISEYQN